MSDEGLLGAELDKVMWMDVADLDTRTCESVLTDLVNERVIAKSNIDLVEIAANDAERFEAGTTFIVVKKPQSQYMGSADVQLFDVEDAAGEKRLVERGGGISMALADVLERLNQDAEVSDPRQEVIIAFAKDPTASSTQGNMRIESAEE